MIILGIETSCDETAVCLIEAKEDSIKILGNQIYSQIALHTQYGGVYPMMAKREHGKNLVPLLEKCLEESGIIKYGISNMESNKKLDSKLEILHSILNRESELINPFIEFANKIISSEWIQKIDAITVTNGPGLEPALWVGVSFAKALSELLDIPIIPTNHMEGHILVATLLKNDSGFKIHDSGTIINHKSRIINQESKVIDEKSNSKLQYKFYNPKYPAIALLISGGHTQLVLIEDKLKYKVIGSTKDDAIGEAYDKVARILGLPYPGGPQISKLAEKEREEFPNKKTTYPLPRPMIHSHDLNFSFSGIKTAVLYLTKDILEKNPNFNGQIPENIKQEIACEFENAVVEVIIKKTKEAIEQYGAQTIIIGGGVSANKKIRNDFENLAKNLNISLFIPEVSASTDNAFMIAVAGYENILSGKKPEKDFKAIGNLSL